MEDFHYLSRLAEVQNDRRQAAAAAREAADRAALARRRPRLSARRLLLSLTLVAMFAVGMAAWWGL